MIFTSNGTRISVNVPDYATLEREVRARLASGQGFALATINLDHLDKLAERETFRQAYAEHDLVVADGNPIVWLSRLAGKPVELLPGSDLVLPLARWAVDTGRSVALVGSTADSLNKASDRLKEEVPGLEVVARIAPPMGFEANGSSGDEALQRLSESGAGLVFLALGAPRQEEFAARIRSALPGTGVASIGAGLDFLAGSQTRAPAWIRALALEWLWRAASSPLRLGPRYARSLLRLPGHVLRALKLRVSER